MSGDTERMEWKPYYRNEFNAPGTREYLEKVFSEAERDFSLDDLIAAGSVLSFPHTALHHVAKQHARVVVALYRTGVEQLIALGVLHLWGHAASSALYSQAMSPTQDEFSRRRAFSALAGAFTPSDPVMRTPFGEISLELAPTNEVVKRDDRGFLQEEFSLDTFFSLLQYYYMLHNRPLPRITTLYIGMTRDPITGSFAVAEKVAVAVRSMMGAKTTVVATGDVIHYGHGYSPQELINSMPGDVGELSRSLRDDLEEVLDLVISRREYQRAFPRLDAFLNNDQRYLLPVIAELNGKKSSYTILSFQLSDYSVINNVDPPCMVASSLVAYGVNK